MPVLRAKSLLVWEKERKTSILIVSTPVVRVWKPPYHSRTFGNFFRGKSLAEPPVELNFPYSRAQREKFADYST